MDSGIINLDAEKRVFLSDGMEDFFYPVSRVPHLEFSVKIMRVYADAVSSHAGVADSDLYKILAKYYISEAVALFQGVLLREKFTESGSKAAVPSDWRIWPALFKGEAPELPKYVAGFRKGVSKPQYARRIFDAGFIKRVIKKLSLKGGLVNVDGLKVKPLTGSVINNDIIATQRTPLIVRHAGEVDDDVVFYNSSKWLAMIGEAECPADTDISVIGKDIVLATEKLFAEFGLPFDDYVRAYLQELIKNSIPVFKDRLEALSRLDNLPQRLWIGTSGNIMDCLLKLAVRRKGGYVCGHDHGTGQAHLVTPLMGMIELWGADAFYTFSKELGNAVPAWSLMDGKSPEIIEPAAKEKYSEPPPRQKEIKHVFLLSTVYDRDRGRMHPLTPDILQLDWQARFISFLKKQKYEVTIKTHPESAFATPPAFENILGANINSERFENVYGAADLFVFDYICTSTFKDALKTDIPVIVVSFDDVEWTDKAYDLISKRCSFIKGYFDENNRMQIDWSGFDAAVKDAENKASDTEFCKLYYI